jgi:hypothetical protein
LQPLSDIIIVRIKIRKVIQMRKPRKRSFAELVSENKTQLLKDRDAMERIEQRIEKKRLGKAE